MEVVLNKEVRWRLPRKADSSSVAVAWRGTGLTAVARQAAHWSKKSPLDRGQWMSESMRCARRGPRRGDPLDSRSKWHILIGDDYLVAKRKLGEA